jgi:hypothetical protein
VLLPAITPVEEIEERHPSEKPVPVSQDQGRADGWSLVLTMLEVLTGLLPFWWVTSGVPKEAQARSLGTFYGNCYEEGPHAMQDHLQARYADLLSPSALAFFKEALVVDATARPTPAQLLAHPYLAQEGSS